jgi:putative ABC transport system permease protein
MGHLFHGLRALFRRNAMEQDLDEELRSYIAIAADKYMAAGMTRDEALRAARMSVGSVASTKDAVRDVGWESRLESIGQDVFHALRGLRRSPGFAAVAVVTLALGIGINAAVFSIVNGLLLRKLPVLDPDRLATISSATALNMGFHGGLGWNFAMWERFRQYTGSFDGSFTRVSREVYLTDAVDRQPLQALFASGEFFSTLGVSAHRGRTFTTADDVRGGGSVGPVAVISHGLWQRRFGGTATVVGMPLRVEGVPYTIVGVTPPGFFGIDVGQTFDLILPLGTEPLLSGRRSLLDTPQAMVLQVMVRLGTGQSLDAATTILREMQPTIMGLSPEQLARMPPWLREPIMLAPASTGLADTLRREYARSLVTLLAGVGLVLLIACVNLTNLVLARIRSRQRELSVRLALGSSRWRLAQQLLTESCVVALIGAVAGLGMALWASDAIVRQLSTQSVPIVLDLPLDWRVLAFTSVVTVVTVLIVGTAPAWRAARLVPMESLRHERHRGSGRPTLPHWRSASAGLVTAEVALSLILLIAAGLFVRTLGRLAASPLGFESDRVLVATLETSRANVSPADRLALFHRLVEAVSVIPGVARASASSNIPLNDPSAMAPDNIVAQTIVAPGWFQTYGIPVRSGRDITTEDGATAQPVVLINEAYVRRFYPGGAAIGREINGRVVVGVTADAVFGSIRAGSRPRVYVPLAQSAGAGPPDRTRISLSLLSIAPSPGRLAPAVASALVAVDPNIHFAFRPLSDYVNASLVRERFVARLSVLLAVLALTLAALGVFGVVSFVVNQRRSEIGVRMALGAQRADVIRLALGRTMAVIAIGLTLGLVGAALVTRYATSMLFEISALDPVSFIAAVCLLVFAAGLAAFVPAYRAARMDPVMALRCE